MSVSALGDAVEILYFFVIQFVLTFISWFLSGMEVFSFVIADQEGPHQTVEPSQSTISHQRVISSTLGLRDGISQTAFSLGLTWFPLDLIRLLLSKEMFTDAD